MKHEEIVQEWWELLGKYQDLEERARKAGVIGITLLNESLAPTLQLTVKDALNLEGAVVVGGVKSDCYYHVNFISNGIKYVAVGREYEWKGDNNDTRRTERTVA